MERMSIDNAWQTEMADKRRTWHFDPSFPCSRLWQLQYGSSQSNCTRPGLLDYEMKRPRTILTSLRHFDNHTAPSTMRTRRQPHTPPRECDINPRKADMENWQHLIVNSESSDQETDTVISLISSCIELFQISSAMIIPWAQLIYHINKITATKKYNCHRH